MNMIDRLEMESKGYSTYDVRRKEFQKGNTKGINFRVSPKPFKLNKSQRQDLENIGKAICDYMDACIELYKTDDYVHQILDRGKPDELCDVTDVNYLFLRPDLILTNNGFSICEIETSPFGLGLAEILNRAYGNEGFNTVVFQNQLKNYIQRHIGKNGTIAYSDKVKAFSGQLDFLAKEVFSGEGKRWKSQNASIQNIDDKEIYRAFYLSDKYSDFSIANLLQEPHIFMPTNTPQFEEKALLAFIWDKRYETFFKEKLGVSTFELLRNVIPKTWIIGEEQFVVGGMPGGKTNSLGIEDLGKRSREFVIKQSGFSNGSSWGEGVKFLHKIGGNKSSELIRKALADKEHLYIIQEFNQGKCVPMTFFDDNGLPKDIDVRIRLTPYYSYSGKDKGKIIAAKVTGCEKTTEYIHASTASINTAVAYDEREE